MIAEPRLNFLDLRLLYLSAHVWFAKIIVYKQDFSLCASKIMKEDFRKTEVPLPILNKENEHFHR